MRVGIQKIVKYLFREKRNQVIDLQGILNEYWDSTEYEVTLLSQS
jgi:hypothetical protein